LTYELVENESIACYIANRPMNLPMSNLEQSSPEPSGGQNTSSSIALDWFRGVLHGPPVRSTVKLLRDLGSLFADEQARRQMPPETVVYRVQSWQPVASGTEAGLFWGVTSLEPGTVGDEYFMTHGHFHQKRNRAEYYATANGHGMLLLMDEMRKTRIEVMSPGTLHYIPGDTAHRVVNTGSKPLVFWACWPSDAGYDYQEILDHGFSARVLERNGQPEVVLSR
jgi:glucose-6-phosphate isomerase